MDNITAKRLTLLPPYLFSEIDRLKAEALERGVDVIDFGVGDPDGPTPRHIVARMQQAVENTAYHRYPSYRGMIELRTAFAGFYQRRFGVELDPETEVVVLIGAKDGVGHIFWSLVDPGDHILLPDPAYPVYQSQTLMAGGEPVSLPLAAERNFLPDLSALPEESSAKLLVLNYPSNPTAAVAPLAFFQQAVDRAHDRGMVVMNDAVYTELAFDGCKPPSLLQADGAREVAVEFHSLSKTYNMTGWRVGCAVGNRSVLDALIKVKMNVDSGVFGAVQEAAIEALTGPQECVACQVAVYRKRRDLLVEGLANIGWQVLPPRATFFVWAPVPGGEGSMPFAARLLVEAGVLVTPGVGFGRNGEGYVRFALTVGEDRIEEALDRIRRVV
jgi:LL-diaminopimelate aminotransferase